MRSYVRFLVSGALTLLPFGATMLVHGGWQAALMAFAVFAGSGFLASMISLRATADRLASPAPSVGRGRAMARRAAAAERPREPAPLSTPTAAAPRLAPGVAGRLQPARS